MKMGSEIVGTCWHIPTKANQRQPARDYTKNMPKRRRPFIVMTSRIPAEHAAKLGWIAAENGTTTADVVRKLIADGVRGAKPPADARTREILASADEWSAWEKIAAEKQTTPGELARRLLNRIVERAGS
jgi:hypothetical protein